MIKALKNLWYKFVAICEEERRREEEKQQMLCENLEAWNRMNRKFIKEMNRRIDKEIEEIYDISKVPEPDAYNLDGTPARH